MIFRNSFLGFIAFLSLGLRAQDSDGFPKFGSLYLSLAAGSRIAALEGGELGDAHGIPVNLGVSIRYDREKNSSYGFVHGLLGVFPFGGGRCHFILGPQVGVLAGGKPAFGLRSDFGYTLGRGLLIGIAAEKDWANRTQVSQAFGFGGWRF